MSKISIARAHAAGEKVRDADHQSESERAIRARGRSRTDPARCARVCQQYITANNHRCARSGTGPRGVPRTDRSRVRSPPYVTIYRTSTARGALGAVSLASRLPRHTTPSHIQLATYTCRPELSRAEELAAGTWTACERPRRAAERERPSRHVGMYCCRVPTLSIERHLVHRT